MSFGAFSSCPVYDKLVSWKQLGPVSQTILSPLVTLNMEKTMVTKVISEFKSISRLKIFRETGPWSWGPRELCALSLSVKDILRSLRAFPIFDKLVSQKQLAIVQCHVQCHFEVIRFISGCPIFWHDILKTAGCKAKRTKIWTGPQEILSIYRSLWLLCSRTFWGHSVHFQFLTNPYLENGWL